MLPEVQGSSSIPQLYHDLQPGGHLDLHDLELLELDLELDLEQDELEAEQRMPRILGREENQGSSPWFYPRGTCTEAGLQPLVQVGGRLVRGW